MRMVCTHWFETVARAITALKPSSFPVKDLVADFPSLRTLDLSACTKVRQGALPRCDTWSCSALPLASPPRFLS
jgi:hypothetical protein